MVNDIRIRPYQEGDENWIIPLLDRAFNGWPRIDLNCTPVEHWMWKYCDGPIKMGTTSVAEYKGNIIGVNNAYAVPILVNGTQIYASFAGDLAVDTEFRGRGLSKKLIIESTRLRAKQNISMIYFVTRIPYLINSYKRDYLEFPFKVALLGKIFDIDLHFKKVPMKNQTVIKTASRIVKKINNISNILQKNSKIHSVTLNEITQFTREYDDFWNYYSNGYDFILDRTREYLNWRYLDPRSGKYRIIQALDAEGIKGFSVTRINKYRDDYPIGFIVDLLVKDGDSSIFDCLVSEACEYFFKHDVNLILVGLPRGGKEIRLYFKHGFLDTRRNFRLFYGDYSKQMKVDNVHFSFGDIDSLPSSIDLS